MHHRCLYFSCFVEAFLDLLTHNLIIYPQNNPQHVWLHGLNYFISDSQSVFVGRMYFVWTIIFIQIPPDPAQRIMRLVNFINKRQKLVEHLNVIKRKKIKACIIFDFIVVVFLINSGHEGLK